MLLFGPFLSGVFFRHTFAKSKRPAAFLGLIFSSTVSNLVWCFYGYKYFLVYLLVISSEFPSRFLKYSFHFLRLSPWLASFNFTLEVFSFCLLHLLSAVLIVRIYLISIFIVLSLNVVYLFFLVFVSSFWSFLSFYVLTFVGFLSKRKGCVFCFLSCFSLTAIDSQDT